MRDRFLAHLLCSVLNITGDSNESNKTRTHLNSSKWKFEIISVFEDSRGSAERSGEQTSTWRNYCVFVACSRCNSNLAIAWRRGEDRVAPNAFTSPIDLSIGNNADEYRPRIFHSINWQGGKLWNSTVERSRVSFTPMTLGSLDAIPCFDNLWNFYFLFLFRVERNRTHRF